MADPVQVRSRILHSKIPVRVFLTPPWKPTLPTLKRPPLWIAFAPTLTLRSRSRTGLRAGVQLWFWLAGLAVSSAREGSARPLRTHSHFQAGGLRGSLRLRGGLACTPHEKLTQAHGTYQAQKLQNTQSLRSSGTKPKLKWARGRPSAWISSSYILCLLVCQEKPGKGFS